MKLEKLILAALIFVGCSLAPAAWAFGDKPMRLIVPGPAGGTIDMAARVIAQQISTDVGRPVIVEDRPGASGEIGLNAMLMAAPDGNTIALGPNNMLVESPLVMKVPYDPFKDIVTIGRVAFTSYVLVSSSKYPAKDFQSLIAHLKTLKGKTSFASYSTGTVSQYAGLIFSNQTDLGMQHVPYQGSPPALQGIIGGQADIMFDGMVTSLPMINSGMLRIYAVAGKIRSKHFPDVPTMTELGYGDIQFQGQIAFYGSSKLPAPVLAKLQATVQRAASAPAVQKTLDELGLEPNVSVDTPALLAEDRRLFARNAGIVKKFGIRAN